MSLNWTFLTKSFIGMRYRDAVCGVIIGKFAFGKYLCWRGESTDNHHFTRIYTHDESDIVFREQHNMHDSAVRVAKTLEFSKRIKLERAKRERELMLDAFNYLNNKNH